MFVMLAKQLRAVRPSWGSSVALIVAMGLGWFALQVPFSFMVGGQGVNFTLFDLFAPVFGAIFGLTFGLIAVLAVNLTNIVVSGNYELAAFIRLVPVLFAVYFFARRAPASVAVSLIAMVLFVAHPIGREVWYYSLFWLIPSLMRLISRDNVFTSAMGATFTQHAVGGVAWLYAFSLPAEVWRSLIPLVIAERFVMGLGIAVSFVALQALVRRLDTTAAWLGLQPSLSWFTIRSR